VLGVGLVRHPPGSQRFQSLGLGVDVGGLDVEVHAVLDRLGLGDALEQELGTARLGRDEQHVLAGAAQALVPEGGSPELGQDLRVGAVQHQSDAAHGPLPL
jgi:hypothetical protein